MSARGAKKTQNKPKKEKNLHRWILWKSNGLYYYEELDIKIYIE